MHQVTSRAKIPSTVNRSARKFQSLDILTFRRPKSRPTPAPANRIGEHSEWHNAVLAADFAPSANREIDIDPRDTGL